MTDLRIAAQQALEALEYAQQDRECPSTTRQAIADLRAALAQQAEPVQDQRCRAEPRSDGDFVCDCKIGECPGRSAEPAQEPVAWRWGYRSVTTGEMDWRGYVEIAAHPNLRSPEIIIEPLYTAPPQRKQAEPAQEPITRLFGTLPVHDTQQAEPVEPVATLIAQRDALLELLKLARSIIGHPDDAHTQMIDAAIKAVEEVPHGVGQR